MAETEAEEKPMSSEVGGDALEAKETVASDVIEPQDVPQEEPIADTEVAPPLEPQEDEKMDVGDVGVPQVGVAQEQPDANKEITEEAEGVAVDESGDDAKVDDVQTNAEVTESPEVPRVEKVSSPTPPTWTPPQKQTSKKPKVDLASVPTRQYLDTTVVPILLQGLSALAKERPQKPIAFLANFLLDKSAEYDDE